MLKSLKIAWQLNKIVGEWHTVPSDELGVQKHGDIVLEFKYYGQLIKTVTNGTSHLIEVSSYLIDKPGLLTVASENSGKRMLSFSFEKRKLKIYLSEGPLTFNRKNK